MNEQCGKTVSSIHSAILESADEFEMIANRIREHVENSKNELPYRWDIDDILGRYCHAQDALEASEVR